MHRRKASFVAVILTLVLAVPAAVPAAPPPAAASGVGLVDPGDGEEDRRAPRADDARGEDRAAEPVLEPLRRDRARRRAPGRQKAMYDQIRQGLVGLDAQRQRRRRHAQDAAARGREQPAQDPDDLRPRRDPRLPHDLPGPARRGGELGPGGDRAVGARRRDRGRRGRASTGRSRRWSTSPATRGGAGSWKARARTRTSARRRPRARVRGFQGKDLAAVDTIAACAKHYAAYGFAEAGRDYNTVDVSEQTLRNVILPPFKAAADAGAATFMNSFNEIGGIPSTGNAHLQRDILKGEWGFQGFVVSDWGSIGEMIPHGFAENLEQAAKHGDHRGQRHGHGVAGVRRPPRGAREVGKRGREARRRRGAPRPPREVRPRPLRRPVPLLGRRAREGGDSARPANLAAARDVARKSIVLLKNEGGLLPLDKAAAKTIAVIGPLADDKDSPLGNWRAQGVANSAVSLLEGVKAAVRPSTQVVYAEGAKLVTGPRNFMAPPVYNTTDRSGFAAAVEAAQRRGRRAARDRRGRVPVRRGPQPGRHRPQGPPGASCSRRSSRRTRRWSSC